MVKKSNFTLDDVSGYLNECIQELASLLDGTLPAAPFKDYKNILEKYPSNYREILV